MTANIVAAETPSFTAPPPDRDRATVETRFGVMTFDRANTISMPRGLLGYSAHREFALANMPDAKLEQFKLLQCLDEPALSFVVAPLNPDSEVIARADIDAACRTLSVAAADAAVLLIVATRRIGAMTQISVNLRAPVIVDVRNQTAWQFVLPNNRYSVRHVIGSGPAAAD